MRDHEGRRILKVLIAEDDPDIGKMTEECVRSAGYDVVLAVDGRETWEKLLSEDPDMLVLDVNMPHRDGFSILKELRQQPPDKKWRPVAIVSALAEFASIQHGYDLEVDQYITKPYSPRELVRSLRIMAPLFLLRNPQCR